MKTVIFNFERLKCGWNFFFFQPRESADDKYCYSKQNKRRFEKVRVLKKLLLLKNCEIIVLKQGFSIAIGTRTGTRI